MVEEIIRFVQSCPILSFSKGDSLLSPNHDLSTLYAIREGYVKVHDIASDGSEQLLSIARTNDFLPFETLFDDDASIRYFYTAFTDVSVYVVHKPELARYVRDNPEILQRILGVVSQKHAELIRLLNAVQKPRAREKLAHALDLLASSFGDDTAGGTVTLDLTLTHQDIASLIGMTRETTSLELKSLKDEGYISYSGGTFDIDTAKLAELL